jgi:hypothetical protein
MSTTGSSVRDIERRKRNALGAYRLLVALLCKTW